MAWSFVSASRQWSAVDEVVPVRDQVAERAALVAERHAAVHAARALVAQRLGRPAARSTAGSRARARRVALLEADPLEAEEGAQLAHRQALPGDAGAARRCSPSRRALGERALVVVRHHLDEPVERGLPVVEEAHGHLRAGALAVLVDQPRSSSLSSGVMASKPTSSVLQRVAEAAVGVVHVGDAAAHAGGEVEPGRAEHDHAAAGHVLAAVVAHALDHRDGARVADREALAGEPAEEGAAARLRRRGRCCRRSRCARRRSRRLPAGAPRPFRPRGPCRSSRSRPRRAPARPRARARRRSSARPSR